MKVDGGVGWDLKRVGAQAQELEDMGYSGIQSAETGHDPFLPLAFAAQHTTTVDLITGIAVAFARTPMVLAHIGHDLNATSEGRFVLGLGSQIRAHITKRFSMPWSSPAARMREFILAMRAIWATWHKGEPLQFTGKFYTHTLMTPFFTPTNNEFGAPRVFLAAVGPLMTEVAGEVADGIIVHAFTTEKYLRETTLPALERGFAKARAKGEEKSRSNFEISYPCFVVTGPRRTRTGCREAGNPPADRILRLDARLQAGAGQRRRGRVATRTQRHVQTGPLGGDGRIDRRGTDGALRGGDGTGGNRSRHPAPFRRCRRSDVRRLRATAQERPGADSAGTHRRVEGQRLVGARLA